jgi:hypothetical protein
MDDVNKAQKVVADLEAKLSAISVRSVELTTDRRRVAFAANTGDKAAAKKLAELTSAAAVIGLEADNLKAAIDEGRQRLVEANRQADLAQRKADALHVKEVAGRISAHGPAITAALDTLRDSFIALTDDLMAVRELGCELAPARLVELSFAEAISSALRPAGLTLLDLAPPLRRHSAEALTTGYADRAAAWSASVLGEKEAA